MDNVTNKRSEIKTYLITTIIVIPFAIFLLMFFTYEKETVENEIVDYIENNCKELPCIVRIKEITDFDWDTMYVFDYGTDVSEVVGTYVPQSSQFRRKLVFTKDGKVIHYDELPTNIEGMVNNQVVFDYDGNYNHQVFKVKDAVFEAHKDSHNGYDIYYYLKLSK